MAPISALVLPGRREPGHRQLLRGQPGVPAGPAGWAAARRSPRARAGPGRRRPAPRTGRRAPRPGAGARGPPGGAGPGAATRRTAGGCGRARCRCPVGPKRLERRPEVALGRVVVDQRRQRSAAPRAHGEPFAAASSSSRSTTGEGVVAPVAAHGGLDEVGVLQRGHLQERVVDEAASAARTRRRTPVGEVAHGERGQPGGVHAAHPDGPRTLGEHLDLLPGRPGPGQQRRVDHVVGVVADRPRRSRTCSMHCAARRGVPPLSSAIDMLHSVRSSSRSEPASRAAAAVRSRQSRRAGRPTARWSARC